VRRSVLLAVILLIFQGAIVANENKFDSGTPHVVIDVQHPSGETHSIGVPADEKIADFHQALLDAGYEHPAIPNKEKGPEKENALEFSERFKADAAKAWGSVASGLVPKEAGYNIDKFGRGGTVETHDARAGETPNVEMSVSPNAVYLLHTHPNGWSDKPSANDQQVARRTKRPQYVVSQSGLWVTDGGKPVQIFSSPTWYQDKEPR
jgi:hypothetical protein